MRPSIASLLLSAIVCTAVASPTSADDRKIASQIAEVMRVSGAMKKYDVGIKYSNGTAWLRGRVADQRQADTAVQIARASPHVQNVVNQLAVSNPSGGSSSGNQVALTAAATPMQTRRASPIPFSGSTLPGSPQQMIRPVAGYAGAPGGPQPAFVPGTGGGVAPAAYDQPSLPGYAWPSYAAYPNYSALTYPKQYSPTAWPYIGPFYPYPQVPLGWRKVSLEWDDGWWFLDFQDH